MNLSSLLNSSTNQLAFQSNHSKNQLKININKIACNNGDQDDNRDTTGNNNDTSMLQLDDENDSMVEEAALLIPRQTIGFRNRASSIEKKNMYNMQYLMQ